MSEENLTPYKRSKFSARFPSNYLYPKSHYWLSPDSDSVTIGLSKFAVRMLGDLVEFGFEIGENDKIQKGEIIGWVEGFKATSDIYSPINCIYLHENSNLSDNPDLLNRSPHSKGWLYKVKTTDLSGLLNVDEYCDFLTETIDRMQGEKT